MKDDRLPVIRELASATSLQVQASNRLWAVLATVSFVALLHRDPAPAPSLPFGLGSIAPQEFYWAVFALLAVLSIAFASAHAQATRASLMAHEALDTLDHGVIVGNLRPRDLFDMLQIPSLIRIAPLAQLFHGITTGSSQQWRRTIGAAYYFALKGPAWLVYFLVPAAALWFTFARIDTAGSSRWLLMTVGALATLPLAQILVADVTYGIRIARLLSRGREPHNVPLQPTSGASTATDLERS
jgi:hypothetical protein